MDMVDLFAKIPWASFLPVLGAYSMDMAYPAAEKRLDGFHDISIKGLIIGGRWLAPRTTSHF
jgi:hypothetical protein